MKLSILAAALCLAPLATAAQEVSDCGWQASAMAIPEPWEDFSRTFANGNVRVALLDTVEPGVVPLWILVLSPPYDELGIRQCQVIGTGQYGFSDVFFPTLTADYDPARRLIFQIDVKVYVPETSDFALERLEFTVNQATGDVTARYR